MLRDYTIHVEDEVSVKEQPSLVTCIENSFDRRLSEHFYLKSFTKLFTLNNFQGVALLRDIQGFCYLDKLAIVQDARGMGLGQLLLSSVIEQTDALIWRSSIENPFQDFYLTLCDGVIKTDDWHLFWIGYPHNVALIDVLQIIDAMPADFE